jgi:hypothetical protein
LKYAMRRPSVRSATLLGAAVLVLAQGHSTIWL